MEEKVKSRIGRRWFVGIVACFVISLIIFVAGGIGIYKGVVGFTASINQGMTRFVVPGSQVVHVDEAGPVSVYYEHRSHVDGQVYDTQQSWPNGLNVNITDQATGQVLPMKSSSMTSNYSTPAKSGELIGYFDVAASGDYLIDVLSNNTLASNKQYVVAVGDTNTLMLVVGILSFTVAVIGGGIFFIGGVALLVIAIVKRKKQCSVNH